GGGLGGGGGGVGGLGGGAQEAASPPAAGGGEGRRLLGGAAGGAVDRVHVHRRRGGGQPRAVLDVHIDRLVGDLVEEVCPPVPLQPGREQGVERALQHVERHRVQADHKRRAEGPGRVEPHADPA